MLLTSWGGRQAAPVQHSSRHADTENMNADGAGPPGGRQAAVAVAGLVATLVVAFLVGSLDSNLPLLAVPLIVFALARWGVGESSRSRAPAANSPGLGFAQALVLCIGVLNLLLGLLVGGSERWIPLLFGAIALILVVSSTRQPRVPYSTREGEYWWVGLLMPFGLGAWAAFAYVGVRTRSAKFLSFAACYLTPIIAGVVLNLAAHDEGVGSDIAEGLWVATWLVAGIHGRAVRETVRRRFDGYGHNPVGGPHRTGPR